MLFLLISCQRNIVTDAAYMADGESVTKAL